MEESVEPVTTSTVASASLPQNPNPEVCKNSTKTREEGELSSSDGDETLAASVAQIDSSLNNSPKDSEPGRCVSTSSPKGLTHRSSATTQQNSRKIERSRTPFVPFVIRFSDEDSGSDSEECRQSEVPETRGNALALNRNVVPPSSGRKWQRFGQTTKSRARMLPGNVSLSRTFVSSMAKVNGSNFKTFNRRSAVQQHGAKQNTRFDSSKLQDLRQQIALREKELKLKSLQHRKETLSASGKEHNVTGSGSDATRKRRASSAEPEKKRLKHIEAHPIQVISDSEQHMPSIQSMVLSRKSLQDNDGQQSINKIIHGDNEMTRGATDAVACQQQRKENMGPPQYLVSQSANTEDGVDVTRRSQSDRNAKPVNPNISSQKTGRESRSRVTTFQIESGSAGLNPSNELNSHCAQLSNKETSLNHLAAAGEFREEGSREKPYNPRSNDRHNTCSLHVPGSNLETSNVSLSNTGLCNCFGVISIAGNNNIDMQSLIEMEELEEKELELAQEHRHKCEMDERNALKAYRNAQRALLEANARCSYLYQKRELHSTRLRNLMMENPSLFWSSSGHNSTEAGLNSSYNIVDENEDLLPASNHQMQAEFNVYDQGYGSNPQAADGALQIVADQQAYHQVFTSNHCSEPDASTPEPCKDRMVEDGVYSPSNDLDGLEDDDGDHDDDEDAFDNTSIHSDFHSQTKDADLGYGEKEDLNDQENRNSRVDYLEESKLLEATLRSQLVARLGAKTSSRKRVGMPNAESNDASGVKDDGAVRQVDEDALLSDKEKNQHHAIGGTSGAETSICELPVQTDLEGPVETLSSNYQSPMIDCLESYNSFERNQSSRSFTSPCPIIRSTFGHTKVSETISLAGLQTRGQQLQNHDVNRTEDYGVGSAETEQMEITTSSFYDAFKNTCAAKAGCYTCDFMIDPLWPLCMFDLRGRCNDDECLFQHARDYSCKKLNIQNSDCQVVSSNKKVKPFIGPNTSMGLDLAPPTYLVCSDVLKADRRPFGSIVARGVGQCWQKCFSTSLVLSSLLPSDFLTDGPFLHGTEARIEIHGSSNTQSYFHSRYCKGQIDQRLADSDQKLEMALLNLNQEADKRKGRIEALKVLSQGLEAFPSSVILWIPYLLIYYSAEISVQKDDLFLYAVEHNEDSYELWLMYINSRTELETRLVAYESALQALCRHASSIDSGPVHASASILDLFLQSMNCLCISGNIDEAVRKIHALLPSGEKSEESLPSFLSEIPQCLTLYDKCVFWLSCVYIVVYKKLPDGLVQQFEFEKELSAIEWPPVCLTADDKQKAVTLMEMAVDSLALYIDCRPLEGESSTLKVAHMFALNHVKFISVIEGLECSRSLLEKYTTIYPSCLELVLMSARSLSSDDLDDLSFSGFEEALRNWPEEVPGVQCIWNQYAEHALQNGRFEFVKELMNRWFCCVWQEQVHPIDGIDSVFGLLNLSLHKSLQNSLVEARLAIDKALRTATGKDYEVCVREHAAFILASDPGLTPADGALSVLRNYSVDALTFPVCEPLTRKFLEKIKKPRVRQLVSNICTSLTSDFSEVNLVLEVCYGASLLPSKFDCVKDLVDMVEAFMEIYPANYRLAMSACKVLSKCPNSTSVSFWGSSLLVNALFRAVPVAAEYVWVEAAAILQTLTDINTISENFHRRALCVYPYSIKLWNSYLNLCRVTGSSTNVIEAARGRGIKLT